jgi:Kef-type K+ transport system membrane component KefB/Trk K+ transport system NAD-binding subunit
VDHASLVNDIALCILCAWGASVVAHQLKQPLILAYLVAGYVIGPQGFELVHDHGSVETIASLGLLLLMFMIGLEIDLKKIVSAGKSILVTGTAQIFGTLALGIGFFLLCGFEMKSGSLGALYLGVAATLSSTVIIIKILYERRELDTLPGRISLGVLVLQDILAIVFLALQPQLNDPSVWVLGGILLKVVVLVGVALLISRFVLPQLFSSFARLPELVLVGALAWCFLVSLAASKLGLSREMGALVAGVAISTFPYTLDVAAKVTTIRDFFITLFFVALGMQIPQPEWGALGWALVIALFVIASRFVTVSLPLYFMKQGLRASLLPAIHLSALSELSVVVVALGLTKGHIGPELFGMVSYAFVILAVLGSFGISKSEKVLPAGFRFMRLVGMRDLDQTGSAEPVPVSGDASGHGHGGSKIFLLGFSWTASSLLEELQRTQPEAVHELAVIDFNPNVHHELKRRGVRAIYGDISQRDTLIHAGIADAEMILCTLPNTLLKGVSNLRLLRQLRELNPTAEIVVHAELIKDVPDLYAAGASHVLLTRLVEAAELIGVIEASRGKRLTEKADEQRREVQKRNEVIP